MGNTRNNPRILQQFRQISSYTRIIRSTVRFFSAANTLTGNTSFATAGVQQGPQCPQQQIFFFPGTCRKARTPRLPPIAPSTSIIRAAKAVVMGRPGQRDRNVLHSSRVQSSRYEPYRQKQPHNKSDQRRRTMRDGELHQHCSLQEMHCCMCQG